MLASLRKRVAASSFLSSSLWILYFFLLSGTASIGGRKISQPEESITSCGMAEASEVGALLLDLIRMISNARQNSCLSERRAQASSSYVFKRKQMQHRLEKKTQNCHIFDSRATKLFRCFLPHGNLCEIHFVDEALCAFCGKACIDYLDIDLYSACHLRFTGKVKAAANALPPLPNVIHVCWWPYFKSHYTIKMGFYINNLCEYIYTHIYI